MVQVSNHSTDFHSVSFVFLAVLAVIEEDENDFSRKVDVISHFGSPYILSKKYNLQITINCFIHEMLQFNSNCQENYKKAFLYF